MSAATRLRRLDETASITVIERSGHVSFANCGLPYFISRDIESRNALLLQPANVEWRLGLTRSVFKQGKFDDAAALLDVLITTYPDKADFWLLQAHTYLGLKEPQKAAVDLEALDAIGKSSVDSLLTLGDIYLSESLPDLALHAYARALAKFGETGVVEIASLEGYYTYLSMIMNTARSPMPSSPPSPSA